MENFQLISMTDFVQNQSNIMYDVAKKQVGDTAGYVYRFITIIPNYANFLKLETAPWMFVPSDESGKPLLVPEMKPERNSFDEEDIDFDAQELHDYLKGKERCLFTIDSNNYEIADDVIFINDKRFMISKETGHVHFGTKVFKTIEDISNDPDAKFWLSEMAILKIGL